jgi:frataxin-like iron-binding protein CyaY
LIGKDTCFCFTISQSKLIAKDLQKGVYNDSILAQTECELETLKEQKLVHDSATSVLQTKIKNQATIMVNQEEALQTLSGDLKSARKKENNQRWQKRLFVAATFIALSFAIIK